LKGGFKLGTSRVNNTIGACGAALVCLAALAAAKGVQAWAMLVRKRFGLKQEL